MAAAGSAVGLGNIWRFPYITGENGGGAFVLIYIFCVILVGVPLLFTEIGLGRMSHKSPIGAFKDTGASKFWIGIGAVMAIGVSFFVLAYYANIAGWTVGYIFKSLAGSEQTFEQFSSNAGYTVPLMGGFVLVTILIVQLGVSGGIEKAAKVLMPLLFVLVLIVAIRAITLPGAMAGLDFYLNPDFSKVKAETFLVALGQAFFSMSIGWGIMITYGSYLSKESNIISSGVWVGFMDAGVALLAGFMIFPAVFAFGQSPAQGQALVFQVLPEIFNSMPGGSIIGAIFFLLLMVAALTSSISMLEVPSSYFIDEKKWSRKKASWIVGAAVFVFGLPAALGWGAVDLFTNMSVSLPWVDAPIVGYQAILDYFWGTFFIVVVALATCLYVGWVIPIEKIVTELSIGSTVFTPGSLPSKAFVVFLRFVCPIVIAAVLLNMLGVFGAFAGGG